MHYVILRGLTTGSHIDARAQAHLHVRADLGDHYVLTLSTELEFETLLGIRQRATICACEPGVFHVKPEFIAPAVKGRNQDKLFELTTKSICGLIDVAEVRMARSTAEVLMKVSGLPIFDADGDQIARMIASYRVRQTSLPVVTATIPEIGEALKELGKMDMAI